MDIRNDSVPLTDEKMKQVSGGTREISIGDIPPDWQDSIMWRRCPKCGTTLEKVGYDRYCGHCDIKWLCGNLFMRDPNKPINS